MSVMKSTIRMAWSIFCLAVAQGALAAAAPVDLGPLLDRHREE